MTVAKLGKRRMQHSFSIQFRADPAHANGNGLEKWRQVETRTLASPFGSETRSSSSSSLSSFVVWRVVVLVPDLCLLPPKTPGSRSPKSLSPPSSPEILETERPTPTPQKTRAPPAPRRWSGSSGSEDSARARAGAHRGGPGTGPPRKAVETWVLKGLESLGFRALGSLGSLG